MVSLIPCKNLTLVQPSVDEIVRGPDDPHPLDIKCGSEITLYKKG